MGPRDRSEGRTGRATWERHQGGQEGGEALGQSLYWYFLRKGKSKVMPLGSVSLNNLGGFWTIGSGSWMPGTGPEMIKAEEHCLLGYTSAGGSLRISHFKGRVYRLTCNVKIGKGRY